MKPHQLCFAVVALGIAGIEAQDPAGFDSRPYQYQREIVGGLTREGLNSLILDSDIYRHSGPSYAKLRLAERYEDRLVELPWIVAPMEKVSSGKGEQVVPYTLESFEEAEDGGIELIVVLSAELPSPVRMEIHTPLRDFEKNVTVFTSGDGVAWSLLVSDALVFDYERFLDFRRTGVELPESDSRHLKVRISNATDQQSSLVRELSRTISDTSGVTITEDRSVRTRAFRIDSLRFLTAADKPDEKGVDETSAFKILEQNPNPERKATEIIVDGGDIPIHEIALTTADLNFRREVSVQIPDQSTPDDWRTIHRGRVHLYRVGGFHDERLSLSFNETRSLRYRLVIENQDSAPLTIRAVEGRGRAYELLFLAGAGDQVSVFLGSPAGTVEPPDLDTAALFSAKDHDVARERLTFGPLTENQNFDADLPADKRLFESKEILWSTIAAVVALLIFVLYRALQHIEVTEDENVS